MYVPPSAAGVSDGSRSRSTKTISSRPLLGLRRPSRNPPSSRPSGRYEASMHQHVGDHPCADVGEPTPEIGQAPLLAAHHVDGDLGAHEFALCHGRHGGEADRSDLLARSKNGCPGRRRPGARCRTSPPVNSPTTAVKPVKNVCKTTGSMPALSVMNISSPFDRGPGSRRQEGLRQLDWSPLTPSVRQMLHCIELCQSGRHRGCQCSILRSQ